MKKVYFAASILFNLSCGKEGGYHITSLTLSGLQKKIKKLEGFADFSRAVIHNEQYTAEEAKVLRFTDAEP